MPTDVPPQRVPVTVVVCSRQRPEFLPDCLRSIDAAMADGDELLVLEDGDSRAAEGLRPLAAHWRHVRADGRTKTWKLNRATQLAANDILIATDDDCRVAGGWIEALLAPFSDAGVGIVFAAVEGMTRMDRGRGNHPSPGPAEPEPWLYSHGASMALRRSAVYEVGGFDERLGPGSRTRAGEEPDLIVRLEQAGWRCVIAAAPAVTHLAWRNQEQHRRTLLNYERGTGAWLGRALRRDLRSVLRYGLQRLRYRAGGGEKPVDRTGQLLGRRLLYQVDLLRDTAAAGRRFGLRATAEFAYGLVLGLAGGRARWL